MRVNQKRGIIGQKERPKMLKPLRVLPVLVCRKGQVKDNFMEEKLKQLKKNLKSDVHILKPAIINEEKDISLLGKRQDKAEAILSARA